MHAYACEHVEKICSIVIPQSYVFTARVLFSQEFADGIVYFSNDDLLMRTKLAKAGGQLKHADGQRYLRYG